MQKIKGKLFISVMVVMLTMAWALPTSAECQDTVKDTSSRIYNIAKASTGNELTVEVNGNEVNFPDQKPFIDEDVNRTYVPLRFVSEALGGNVDWKGQEQTATVDRNGKHIEMQIGSQAPMVDGKEKSLDAPARLTNARTVVPLRFVSEALGAKVEWIADTRTVVITDNQGSTQQPDGPQEPAGDTYTKQGYTIPKEDTTKLMVHVSTDEEINAEISSCEISIGVNLDFPLEPQYEDLHNILESKFGTSTADKVVNYIKPNKTRFDTLPEKRWKADGETIRAYSPYGAQIVNIEVWRNGVNEF